MDRDGDEDTIRWREPVVEWMMLDETHHNTPSSGSHSISRFGERIRRDNQVDYNHVSAYHPSPTLHCQKPAVDDVIIHSAAVERISYWENTMNSLPPKAAKSDATPTSWFLDTKACEAAATVITAEANVKK